MKNNQPDRSDLWEHIHGEADPASTAQLHARAQTDEELRAALESRTQMDERFRRLLKLSEKSREELEERIGDLWEKTREPIVESAGPARTRGRLLVLRWPAAVALAASAMLVVGSLTMRPEGLVWMAPGLDMGAERGLPGSEEVFYSAAEVQGFARTLQEAIAATYEECGGAKGWSAWVGGRQRHVRPTIRQFPDGRILATVEAFREASEPPVGVWSESFANADEFRLNAGDWAGLVAEEIVTQTR